MGHYAEAEIVQTLHARELRDVLGYVKPRKPHERRPVLLASMIISTVAVLLDYVAHTAI